MITDGRDLTQYPPSDDTEACLTIVAPGVTEEDEYETADPTGSKPATTFWMGKMECSLAVLDRRSPGVEKEGRWSGGKGFD